jgi:hypothetical protein
VTKGKASGYLTTRMEVYTIARRKNGLKLNGNNNGNNEISLEVFLKKLE